MSGRATSDRQSQSVSAGGDVYFSQDSRGRRDRPPRITGIGRVTIVNFFLIVALILSVYTNHLMIDEIKNDLRFAIGIMGEVADPVTAARVKGRYESQGE